MWPLLAAANRAILYRAFHYSSYISPTWVIGSCLGQRSDAALPTLGIRKPCRSDVRRYCFLHRIGCLPPAAYSLKRKRALVHRNSRKGCSNLHALCGNWEAGSTSQDSPYFILAKHAARESSSPGVEIKLDQSVIKEVVTKGGPGRQCMIRRKLMQICDDACRTIVPAVRPSR